MVTTAQHLFNRVLRTFGYENLPPLDEYLTSLERVYRLPPLTPALVQAISPHLPVIRTDHQREIQGL